MLPERISVKFFVNDEDAVATSALIPVFHRWIRERSVPGLPIDVADYKHVPDGPGVLLMGHEGDYAWDGRYGRLGLVYKHKREWTTETFAGRLNQVLERAKQAVELFQAAPELQGISFQADEIELSFPDRLNIPNRPETLAELQDTITAVLQDQYPDKTATLTHVHTEARRPFTVKVSLAPAAQLFETAGILLRRL